MIEQRGIVTAVRGERARVRLGGQSGCPACDAGQGCGAGLFGKLLRRTATEVSVPNTRAARPGEPVILGIPEAAYLSLVLRLYGWPLLAGLAGAGLAQWLAGGPGGFGAGAADAAAVVGALALGGLALRGAGARSHRVFTRRSLRMLDPAAHLDCASFDRNQ